MNARPQSADHRSDGRSTISRLAHSSTAIRNVNVVSDRATAVSTIQGTWMAASSSDSTPTFWPNARVAHFHTSQTVAVESTRGTRPARRSSS